jgi:hypothetical protein
MATTEPLTEQEQQALEQMREAHELGSTLKDHAAKIGLDVRQLYELRRRLVRKGAFGPLPGRKTRKSRKADAFVPVRVVPAAPIPSSTSVTCRLVHPSGWVLECDGLPPASWMAAVLAGGAHAAP